MADQKPVMGAAILAALTAYGIANKRQRRKRLVASFGDQSEGRLANEPHEIGQRGWREILRRLLGDVGRDNLSLMSAGVAFYALLSLAPGFTALIALYGLVFDTSEVQRQVQYMEGMIPAEGRRLVADQLTHIVQASNSKLGLGLIVSLAIALWSGQFRNELAHVGPQRRLRRRRAAFALPLLHELAGAHRRLHHLRHRLAAVGRRHSRHHWPPPLRRLRQ